MTFSVVMGYFVIQLHAPVAVKYPLIVLASIVLTLLTSELVRRWNVTRLLFGLKPARLKPKREHRFLARQYGD
jgi:hypothetical protein